MTNNLQEDYAAKVGLLQFFGAVKGTINDLNSKVIDGVKVNNIDLQRLAIDYDKTAGVTPQPISQPQQAPVHNYQQSVTIAVQPTIPEQNENDDQLLLPFNKKYGLDDIFFKIDEVYRKIISLENEVYKLKDLIENKKKEL